MFKTQFKTAAVCLMILSTAFMPGLAQAGVFSDLYDACKRLLGVSATQEAESSLITGFQLSADGRFGVEIDEISERASGEAYIYDTSVDKSGLKGIKDPRILAILTDDLSGTHDRTNIVGYIDSSWSPDGQILVLLDGYGNIAAYESRYFEDLLQQKNSTRAKKPVRTKVKRHAGLKSFTSGIVFMPNINWLSNRTVEIRSGEDKISMVATVTDEGVIGLRISAE